MNWYRKTDLLKATGPFAGIRAIRRPDGWWVVDGRGEKDRAFGPYWSDSAARAAAESRFEAKGPTR